MRSSHSELGLPVDMLSTKANIITQQLIFCSVHSSYNQLQINSFRVNQQVPVNCRKNTTD